jgi:hypothetical protein
MSSYEKTRIADIAGDTINPATEEGQINLLTELELKANITDIQPVNDAAITNLIAARSTTPSALEALNVQLGVTDAIFGVPALIRHSHEQVHLGNTFKALDSQAVGAGTVQYAIETVTEFPHMLLNCDVYDGSVRVDLYKTATFTGGTALTKNNRNQNSANTSAVIVTGGVTSTDGTLIESFYVGASNKSAGQTRADAEWILEDGAIYRIDLVGLIPGAMAILSLNWYNS